MKRATQTAHFNSGFHLRIKNVAAWHRGQLRFISLALWRFYGDLASTCKTPQGQQNSTLEATVWLPTHPVLRGRTFTVYHRRCGTWFRQHAFSICMARFWSKSPEEIAIVAVVDICNHIWTKNGNPIFMKCPKICSFSLSLFSLRLVPLHPVRLLCLRCHL